MLGVVGLERYLTESGTRSDVSKYEQAPLTFQCCLYHREHLDSFIAFLRIPSSRSGWSVAVPYFKLHMLKHAYVNKHKVGIAPAIICANQFH